MRVTTHPLGDPPGRVPGHDMVLLRAGRIDIGSDAAKIQRLFIRRILPGWNGLFSVYVFRGYWGPDS